VKRDVQSTPSRAGHALLGPWLVLLAACGSPDGATPMPEPLALDPDKIARATTVVLMPFLPVLAADAGAAPPGATVRLTNLDDTAPSASTVAEADGSFRFDLGESVQTGDELRLQAVLGGRRGPPLDFSTELGVSPSERHGCVVLQPGFELTFEPDSRARLEFQNRCATEVLIDAPRARLGLPEFELGMTALPTSIARNATGSVEVVLSAANGPELEETLLLDVTAEGRVFRTAITLYFPGAPP